MVRVLVLSQGSFLSKVRYIETDYEVYTKDLHTFKYTYFGVYASIDKGLLVTRW